MKFSMTGKEKSDFFNTGDCLFSRGDCKGKFYYLNKNWKKLLVQTKCYWAREPVLILRTGQMYDTKFFFFQVIFNPT